MIVHAYCHPHKSYPVTWSIELTMNTNLNLKAKINNIVFQKISICAGLESKIALVGENAW